MQPNRPFKVSYQQAEEQARALRVNTDVVSIERLQHGMQVELEHGTVDSRTDVTGGTDDLSVIAKIALAHFKENPGTDTFPDYYRHLLSMEKSSERYWNEWRNAGGTPPMVLLPEPEPARGTTLADVLRRRNKSPQFYGY